MALVNVCDICGAICNLPNYELIHKGVLRDHSYDICKECIDRIKKEIKETRGVTHES